MPVGIHGATWPQAALLGAGIKTVTVPLGGTGAVEGTKVAANFLWRIPIYLPVNTVRWRLRSRNFNCNTVETAGSGMTLLSVWLGKPKFNKGRWKGAFVAGTLKQVLGQSPINAGGDSLSDWVEAVGAQFRAYEPAALSLAFEKGANTTWFFDEFGGPLWGGEAANVGNPAEPGGALSNFNGFDLRLEYEYVPNNLVLGSLGNQIGVVFGDSIAGGYALSDGGVYSYEGYPNVAALRQGHPIMWTGPAGAKTNEFLNLASWRYRRLNLETSVPTYAVIQLGVNDSGTLSQEEYENNITSMIEKIQNELKIPTVYLATAIPFKAAAGRETARQNINAFLRSVPSGAQGVIDLDAQLRKQAAPSEIEAIWGENSEANPHVNRPAYQRMAGALILP